MNSQLFDDCDVEVWTYFPENLQEVKEFTLSPQRPGLMKPIPVRLEPPFPWDCGQGYTVNREVTTNRASAFIPVSKATDDEVAGVRQRLQEVPQKVKGTQLSKTAENRNTKSDIPSNNSLQKKLLLAFSELTSLRADLRAIKQHGQSLEQKNKKLQTRIGKYKEENLVLRKKYEGLVQESERLKSEMVRLQSGQEDIQCEQDAQLGGSGGTEINKEIKLKELTESGGSEISTGVKGKHHKDVKEMLSGCYTKSLGSASVFSKKEVTVATTLESVEQKKKNKKRSVFKQLRKAFRKMTA